MLLYGTAVPFQCGGLTRQAVALKQDEEALIREMDITGEAFEDLQEQNARLIKQLREKDDANFKVSFFSWYGKFPSNGTFVMPSRFLFLH